MFNPRMTSVTAFVLNEGLFDENHTKGEGMFTRLGKLGLVLLICVGGFSACSTKETTDDPKDKALTLAESVIYDKDGIKMIIKGIDDSATLGPTIDVTIENDSKASIMVQTNNFSINGYMVMDILAETVAAGKKANAQITILSTSLNELGITLVKDIEFTLSIRNSESYAVIDESTLVKVSTNADVSKLTIRDFKGTTVLEKNGFKIVYVETIIDSIAGSKIFFYVENSSSNNGRIQGEEVSVNGFMLTPVFNIDVAAGKKAYGALSIMSQDLKDNNITKITALEMIIKVFDQDTFSDLASSDVVKLTITEKK